MSNSILCYQCQATLRYGKPPDKPRKAKCPRCGTELTIPAGQESQAPVREPLADTLPPGSANALILPDDAAIVTPTAAPRPAPQRQDAFTPARHDYPGAAPEPRHRQDDDPEPRRRRERDDYGRDDRPRDRDPDRGRDRDRRRPRDDDYDAPRPKKTRRRGGKGLVLGLSLGIGGLLVIGVVLLLVFTLGGAGNPLVGKWRPDVGIALPVDTGTIEFTSSGNVLVTGPMKMATARYRMLDSQSFEMEIDDIGFGGGPFGGGGGRKKEITYFRIEGDVLHLSSRPGGSNLRLRRAG